MVLNNKFITLIKFIIVASHEFHNSMISMKFIIIASGESHNN